MQSKLTSKGESNPTCELAKDEDLTAIGEDEKQALGLAVTESLDSMEEKTSIIKVLLNPLILLLGLAACIRHSGKYYKS